MAKCFYCCHCGKCGPSSYSAFRNPDGYCPFCHHMNDPEATECANCGKPLPKPAGVQGSQDDEPPAGR